MKVCNNCGATIHDNATYCPNCGGNIPAVAPHYYSAPAKEPVSVGGWIGRSLIPFIPIVGGIVYFIMLCIWSGDTKKEDTFRNWAKAQLVVVAISIVLSIIIFVAFGAVISDLMYYLY